MDSLYGDIPHRAESYALRYAIQLEVQLGAGRDGIVWRTDQATAVKVYLRPEPFHRELAAYKRLSEHDVLDVLGHRVPQFVQFDDELLVIEMTIVQRPFLLDFASAYLDSAPDFPDEVIEQWYEDKLEQFGDRWDQVQLVLACMQGSFGIYLTDVNPGNITFGEGEA